MYVQASEAGQTLSSGLAEGGVGNSSSFLCKLYPQCIVYNFLFVFLKRNENRKMPK